jgi:MYXO-CTERM domain-containing protein
MTFVARVVGVSVVVLPAVAGANELHPRTPVRWGDAVPCMTVVDRGVSAQLHFPYEIEYEDLDLTPEELPSGRRHQFIALCRDHSALDVLPNWLSWQDVDAYDEWIAGLGQRTAVPMNADVVETSSWNDCVVRITPDDARRPISFAEAAKGVGWDTSEIAAGAYVIEGYTWEPAFNLWRHRPGVVHVVDGPDLATVGPAAALMNTEDYVFMGDTLTLQGCARALPGSTLTGFWSPTDPPELNWQPFAAGVPLMGETIALPFSPPPAANQTTIALRVDVTDPLQRTFSAFPPALLAVLPGPECGGGFVSEPCGTDTTDGSETGDSGTSGGGSAGGSTDGSAGGPTTGLPPSGGTAGSSTGDTTSASGLVDRGEPLACGCRSTPTTGWGLAVLTGLAIGRRRRAGQAVLRTRRGAS